MSWLLLAVVVMSLADLYMTLLHMSSFGMLEANPLARHIIERGSPALLVLWKLATIAFAAGILFAARRTRIGEGAAWVCALVMTALMCQWVHYSSHVSGLTKEMSLIAASGDTRWVSFNPGG